MKQLAFYIRQILVLFLAIQIMNMSLDSMEFRAVHHSNEVSSFNELNTVIEYFAEIVLGHKNAFPEYNNAKSSSKDYPLQKQIDMKVLPFQVFALVNCRVDVASNFFVPLNEKFISGFYKEINPPPPKA